METLLPIQRRRSRDRLNLTILSRYEWLADRFASKRHPIANCGPCPIATCGPCPIATCGPCPIATCGHKPTNIWVNDADPDDASTNPGREHHNRQWLRLAGVEDHAGRLPRRFPVCHLCRWQADRCYADCQ